MSLTNAQTADFRKFLDKEMKLSEESGNVTEVNQISRIKRELDEIEHGWSVVKSKGK